MAIDNVKAHQPIGLQVLLMPTGGKIKESDGIHIPDTVQVKQNKFKVICLGTGEPGKDFYVKEGDHVMANLKDSIEIILGGEKCMIVKNENIIARFEIQ